MLSQSYKDYLSFIEKSKKPSILKRSLFLTSIFALIILGISSAFIYYFYQKENPVRAQNQYLELANGGFATTKQSLEELLVTFQIAGSKTALIDTLKESTSSSLPGYFVTLDDLTKILAKIESVRASVAFQKDSLKKEATPKPYQSLNSNLISFYEESEKLLNDLYKNYQFAKDLLLATGPNFYLPTLSNESLWQKGQKGEIKSYYENIQKEAANTFAKLSKLSVPDGFADYLENQIIYLQLVQTTSANIISTLSQEESTDPQRATQLEIAYQQFANAKRENEALFEKVLQEKLKLTSLKKNFDKFAYVRIKQNSLEAKLADAFSSQPQSKIEWLILKYLAD